MVCIQARKSTFSHHTARITIHVHRLWPVNSVQTALCDAREGLTHVNDPLLRMMSEEKMAESEPSRSLPLNRAIRSGFISRPAGHRLVFPINKTRALTQINKKKMKISFYTHNISERPFCAHNIKSCKWSNTSLLLWKKWGVINFNLQTGKWAV